MPYSTSTFVTGAATSSAAAGADVIAKGKNMWDEEDAGVDELLAMFGYKVKSSDMVDVAQKIEHLEGVFGNDDELSQIASDSVHYNPSDLNSWLESMICELNPATEPFVPINLISRAYSNFTIVVILLKLVKSRVSISRFLLDYTFYFPYNQSIDVCLFDFLVQMEALYSKLYDKYTKLKVYLSPFSSSSFQCTNNSVDFVLISCLTTALAKKASEMEQISLDQEEKFKTYVSGMYFNPLAGAEIFNWYQSVLKTRSRITITDGGINLWR
ncbi:hypothetical protein E3N88_25789 [Mikania micrantha]|uniref:Transcriptional factor DELLA N-terminal domain-containing protein n=1 Tax=Mikania micrantha TaxID=192012 RepID=A0A5N6N7B7_9ASTR|nr:hypothetical protein E3N88_25789 [Mikania micrantha]